MGMALYIVYLLIWMIGLSFFIGWFVFLLPLVFAVSGYFFLQWYESFTHWKNSVRLKSVDSAVKDELLEMRRSILDEVGLVETQATQ